MRLSQYFIPTLRDKPHDAEIISHVLMLRSGMIRQAGAAGIYSWLPLGLQVLNNIANIAHKKLKAAGCIELLMPCTQPLKLWQESNRLDAYGKEMLQIQDRHDNFLVFGPTCEELVTDIVRGDIKSYKQLPKNFYHIQWKFRDEIRPRFGVMRAREFLMKDGYSFDLDKESAIKTYKKMFSVYLDIFKAIGVKAIPVHADSGAIGGNLCHEFHVLANSGESTIYYDKALDKLDTSHHFDEITKLYASVSEKHNPENCNVPDNSLTSSKAIEVGHIFYFGTKYTEIMQTYVQTPNGLTAPHAGSYGIGISRLVGAIIEANHDDRGIKWPIEIAPFIISLINLDVADAESTGLSDNIYNVLLEKNISVLYDDSNDTAGSKFANHDLIGSPWQIIIGSKLLKAKKIEIKNRQNMEKYQINVEEAIPHIMALINQI